MMKLSFFFLLLFIINSVTAQEFFESTGSGGSHVTSDLKHHRDYNIGINAWGSSVITHPLHIFGRRNTAVNDIGILRFEFDDSDQVGSDGVYFWDIIGKESLIFSYDIQGTLNPVLELVQPLTGAETPPEIVIHTPIVSPNGNRSFGFNGTTEYFIKTGSGSSMGSFYQNDEGEFIFGSELLDPSSVQVHGELFLSGKATVNEIEVVDPVPMPDYVFEESYEMMSISEINDYIKNNKHLPGVPSASHFSKNGYNVSEMDRMLLEKIEELTLYIIQLEEQFKALK